MGKYRNREVIYKGIKFDSILERNAYMRLEFLGVKFYYHKTTYRIKSIGKGKFGCSCQFYNKVSQYWHTPMCSHILAVLLWLKIYHWNVGHNIK